MVISDGTDDRGLSASDVELSRLRSENEALHSRLAMRTRWRRWLTVVLVVLAALSVESASRATRGYPSSRLSRTSPWFKGPRAPARATCTLAMILLPT